MAIQLTIEDHFIPYLVLLFNVITVHLLRCLSRTFIETRSESLHLIINELISTVELCACCAELGPVWELHGNYGVSISLFLLCAWWCQIWGDAEACPCGPFEEFIIMGRRPFGSPELLHKLLAQTLGAWLTSRYTNWIWCWHLTEQHHHLHEAQCEASLYVTPLYGAIIEALITFISRFVALESNKWNNLFATIANSATSVILVLLAMNTTGGFFNPILASALMIGCKGHTYWEHFQVYWLGSIIGSLTARWLHYYLPNGTTKDKWI